MGYRINERNAGNWTLDGEPKTRKSKAKAMSADDKRLLFHVLERVIDCMEFDPTVSEFGHLHPSAKFTDGGRFMLCLSREQFEQLVDIKMALEK